MAFPSHSGTMVREAGHLGKAGEKNLGRSSFIYDFTFTPRR